jgi:hypothetical protein
MFPSLMEFSNRSICFALIKRPLVQLRHATLVKRQAFFAVGIPQMRVCSAKSEQLFANYGERSAQTGRPVVCTERKNYEDTHNLEPAPGDGGISEPL